MPEVVVPVDWKPQQTAYYCGPAAAQMMLLALGASVPSDPGTGQDQLWNDITANTGAHRPAGASGAPSFPAQFCEKCDGDWRCWSTTPDALVAVLGLYQNTTNFGVEVFSDEDDLTDTLLDNIDHGLAGFALIYGWEHWVVVHGYVTGTLKVECTVGGRAIDGVYVRNPEDPPDSMHLVKCHDWHDDCLEFIACGEYVNKIVAVVGSAPKAKRPSSKREVRRPARRRVDSTIERPMGPPATLVAPVRVLVEAGLAAGQLLTLARWRPALALAVPQGPLLVRRLDRAGGFYYIVPFARDDKVRAHIAVDAVTGLFTEVVGVESQNNTLPAFVPPPAGQFELVWQPCHESMSPFVPFYLFTVDGKSAYRRVDGRQFSELTTGPA